MAQLIVRNLDEAMKVRLRLLADSHGRSMEEEVRQILSAVLNQESSKFGDRLASRFSGIGEDLEIPELRGEEANFPRWHE